MSTEAKGAGVRVEPDRAVADDIRLVADVLRKDRKATAEFVARYADCVYAYVRWRVMSRSEAVEDLVQEIFLAAWKSLGNFQGQAGLRPWLLGIARHKVEDYYRRRLREAEWSDLDEASDGHAVIPSYDERLDRASEQEQIRRTLAGLPEPYGLVLLWRYLENRSVREIARLTGRTEKAIERLLARAREQFRKRWNHAES